MPSTAPTTIPRSSAITPCLPPPLPSTSLLPFSLPPPPLSTTKPIEKSIPHLLPLAPGRAFFLDIDCASNGTHHAFTGSVHLTKKGAVQSAQRATHALDGKFGPGCWKRVGDVGTWTKGEGAQRVVVRFQVREASVVV